MAQPPPAPGPPPALGPPVNGGAGAGAGQLPPPPGAPPGNGNGAAGVQPPPPPGVPPGNGNGAAPIDVTFTEPAGTSLGITFMEYKSRFSDSSYLAIENLKDTAQRAHPELRPGLIVTAVNGKTTAQMPTEQVKQTLRSRPCVLTLADKMVDAAAARTMTVANAAIKWKAGAKRQIRRRQDSPPPPPPPLLQPDLQEQMTLLGLTAAEQKKLQAEGVTSVGILRTLRDEDFYASGIYDLSARCEKAALERDSQYLSGPPLDGAGLSAAGLAKLKNVSTWEELESLSVSLERMSMLGIGIVDRMKLQEYVVSCKMNRLGLAHLEQAKLRAEGVMRSEIGAKILLRDHDFETAGIPIAQRRQEAHQQLHATGLNQPPPMPLQQRHQRGEYADLSAGSFESVMQLVAAKLLKLTSDGIAKLHDITTWAQLEDLAVTTQAMHDRNLGMFDRRYLQAFVLARFQCRLYKIPDCNRSRVATILLEELSTGYSMENALHEFQKKLQGFSLSPSPSPSLVENVVQIPGQGGREGYESPRPAARVKACPHCGRRDVSTLHLEACEALRPWSTEEDERLCKLVERQDWNGSEDEHWSAIASNPYMGKRTANQCRDRFLKHLYVKAGT